MPWYKHFEVLLLLVMPFEGIYSQEYNIPESYTVKDICSSDMDLDGDLDLVICSANDGTIPDSLYIFYNDGLGRLNRFSLNRTNKIFIISGKIDTDDYDDIITKSSNGIIFIRNNGDGTFGEEISIATSENYKIIDYIEDMDGDGLNDLVYTYSGMYTKWGILKNEGDLVFSDHIVYNNGNGGNLYPTIGLLNDDNLPDVCLSFIPQKTHFLINQGNLSFDTTLLCNVGWNTTPICKLNDITPDDIAVFSVNTGELLLFENTGNNEITIKDTLSLSGPVMVTDVADYNNDGFDDYSYALCYWTGCTDSIYIAINDQQWGFLPPQRYYVGNMQFFQTETSDLNGDGYNDIVLYGYSPLNELKILWNDGFGGFTYENPVKIKENNEIICRFNVEFGPNPFTSSISISIKSNQISQYIISIADIFGRRIYYNETRILKPDENFSFEWDGKDLSQKDVTGGLYFLTVIDFRNNFQTIKLLKIN